MNKNKKYYYFTYIRKDDGINTYNTAVTDEHPIEYIIKQNGNIVILYSIEITKEQCDRFAYAVRNN